ncbi:MAG: putative acetyltransferase [Flavobacterium sp.]
MTVYLQTTPTTFLLTNSACVEVISFSRILEKDRENLESLLQIYLHELSKHSPIKKSDLGLYLYPYLQFYWQESDRVPYFIKSNEDVCGFAMIRQDKNPLDGEDQMELAEFFILKAYRRLHIGSYIAEKLWDLYPTNWRVSVLHANDKAQSFWAVVINKYAKGQFELVKNAHTISYYFCSRSART